MQIADAVNVVLLPVTEQTAKQVAEEFGIIIYTIPKGAYEWNDSDVLTVSLSAHLFALDTYSNEIVSKITTALISNIDSLKSVHTAMAPLDTKLMVSSKTIPYHPGANEVYTSSGIIE